MKRREFGALSLAVTFAASPAAAQGGKVTKLVVGFPAGQGIDLLARLVAEKLKDELGDTVIVENKPGQGGSIALGQVARAASDGSTLLISAMAALVMAPHLYRNVTYDTLTSFQPVARVADLPLVLVVNPALPVKALDELIAYAKANPDKLSHSSSGNSTVSHIAMEELKRAAGMRIVHVPYQGSAAAMTDLVAGNVMVAMDTVSVTRPHIQAGRLRLIAAGSLERLPFFPDTPTIAELGFPGFEANAWVGILVPALSAPDNVARLATALRKIVDQPDMRTKLDAIGALPKPSTTTEFEAFLKAEYARWGKAIAASGVKAD